MIFTEHFNITKSGEDDWLDIILDVDTKLWVDPFLIFKDTDAHWAGAHSQIIQHFQTCFDLIVQGGMREHTLPYQKALSLLTFREPKEFCLGFTVDGTDGAGAGRGYARLIAKAMVEAINRGLSDLEHFEELGILEKGIGADRISDLTCNILKGRFIEYTKAVAARHSLETRSFVVRNALYNSIAKRWENGRHDLPVNPSNGEPILLTPERFIRDQPTLNAEAWFDYYQHEQLRQDTSYEILTNVDKTLIVNTARQHAQEVRDWTDVQQATAQAEPYNLASDPNGVYRWDKETRQYVYSNPLSIAPPTNDEEFLGVIDQIIGAFRRYIQENRGWSLLWNDNGVEKNEEAAQLVFLGIAKAHCKANNINVDREVEIGRGPVDFKFSNGHTFRALLEIKKLHNGDFWQGIERQLPTYLEGDDCQYAWYVAIQYRPGGISAKRAPRLTEVINNLQEESGKIVKYELVNAIQRPPSASVA